MMRLVCCVPGFFLIGNGQFIAGAAWIFAVNVVALRNKP